MRILITGASGKLGRELTKLIPNALTPSHQELDVSNERNIYKYIQENLPDVVIHLAAFVSPAKCEIEKEKAWVTNVSGTKYLVEACEKFAPECYFLLISTPCVFSGKEGNYHENSLPYPENFYSVTKFVQEIIIQQSKLRFCIMRGNFVSFEKYPYPKAFTDRWGTYLFAHQLARAILDVIIIRATGIIHLVGNKKISMY
ncbi:MAG: sugar nucleotide-binding protein, partial [Nanoarchaeota archaeon]